MHQRVLTNDDSQENTEHNPFVDDTFITETKEYMSWAVAPSIEEIFSVFGMDGKSRKYILSLEEFMEEICFWQEIQLGLMLDFYLIQDKLPLEKQKSSLSVSNRCDMNIVKSSLS